MTSTNSSSDGDWIAGVWFLSGLLVGCFAWTWGFDSNELSAAGKWLGQGVTIAASIVLVSSFSLIARRRQSDWPRVIRGALMGGALIVVVWGAASIDAYWFDARFANGAWCMALGVFGFAGHKLQGPDRRVGWMYWVYSLFFAVGVVSMYASVSGAPEAGDDGGKQSVTDLSIRSEL